MFYDAVDAVIHGHVDRLRALLTENPELAAAGAPAEHAGTLLHYVAANGVEDELQKTPANAVEVATVLLDAGAEPDALCNIYGGGPGTTPMVALVTSAHPAEAGVQGALVELLCARGADPNGVQDDGLPMAMALSFFYPDAAGALLRAGARVDNPVYAAAAGDLQAVRSLLGDAAPMVPPFEQMTAEQMRGAALMYACLCGRLAVVEWLVDRLGVSVDQTSDRNIHGCEVTAMHMAAASNQVEIVEWLVARGAVHDRPDGRWGSTPAFWAHLSGHEELAKRLA